MQKRMNAHPKNQGYKALVESLGADVLPEEFGGTNGKIQDHIGKILFFHQESNTIHLIS